MSDNYCLLRVRIAVFASFLLLSMGELSASPVKWTEKMRELSVVLPEIIVDVANESRFNQPETQKRLKKNALKLSKLSHNIKKDRMKTGGPLDKDPSIKILGNLFEEDSRHAYRAISNGNYRYARSLLKSMSSYCIACHTRTDMGPKFPKVNFDKKIRSLKTIEKADFYAATRRFKPALAEYVKFFSNEKNLKTQPLEWNQAVRKALNIAVRVDGDPKEALNILDKLPKKRSLAFYIENESAAWKDSLKQWQNELSQPKREINTALGFFTEAERLIGKAHKLQKYPADEAGKIYYLRASALLHEALSRPLEKKYKAQALFLTGMCYESIDAVKFWTLPEHYYQACIEEYPHSKISEQCLVRYERSVLLGFSGSSGVHMPKDVEIKLNQLKAKALRQSKQKK